MAEQLTPSEMRRLAEVEARHKESVDSSNTLKDAILSLAESNKRDGGKNANAYTDNVLDIRTYTTQMSKAMTDETRKLFDALEELNVDSRKQTKTEQLHNRKQLKVLEKLAENVGDDQQREQLSKFIKSTDESIKRNTTILNLTTSAVMQNLGNVGAVISGLLDSPFLALASANIGTKINDMFQNRREESMALQEGQEAQLAERYGEILELQKEEIKIRQEIARRQSEESKLGDSEKPQQVEVPTTEGVSASEFAEFDTMFLEEMSAEIHTELLNIKEELQLMNLSLDEFTGVSTPIEVTGVDKDLFEMGLYELMEINEKMTPLVVNNEEDKREKAVFNEKLLSALENLSNGANADGSKIGDINANTGGIESGLNGIISGFTQGLMSKLRFGLRAVVAGAGKLITKVFVPLAIVGSLFSGVMEAIDIYKDTGSLYDATVGFFGGILDFVTFGFFGTEQLNALIETIIPYAQKFGEILLSPFTMIYDKAKDIFGIESFTEVFEKIQSFDLVKMLDDSITSVIDTFTGVFDKIKNINVRDLLGDTYDSILDFIGIEDTAKPIAPKLEQSDNTNKLDSVSQDIADVKDKTSGITLTNTDNPNTTGKVVGELYTINGVPVSKDEYGKYITLLKAGGMVGVGEQGNSININQNNNTSKTTNIVPRANARNDDPLTRKFMSSGNF